MSTFVWQEEQPAERGIDTRLLRWALLYARPHAVALGGCIVLLLMLAGLQLWQPYLLKIAIDDVITPAAAAEPALRPGLLAPLRRLVLLYAASVVSITVLLYVQLIWLRKTGIAIITTVREDLFTHLQTLDMAFYDREPVGRLVTRATNDVEALNEMYTHVLVNLFADLFYIVGALVVLFALDARLALVACAVLPFVSVIAVVFRRHAREAWRAVRWRLARINAQLAESFAGMRVIQVFAREGQSSAEFRAINDDFFAAAMVQIRVFALFRPAIDLLTAFAIAALIGYGGGRVLAETLTIGTLFAFTVYVNRLFEPINALAEKYNVLQSALAAAERITQLLATEPAVADGEGIQGSDQRAQSQGKFESGVPPSRGTSASTDPSAAAIAVPRDADAKVEPPPTSNGAQTVSRRAVTDHDAGAGSSEPAAVEFEGVWFAYAGEDWVLRDVNLRVAPGETVAFVGHTGAGKSTIMNLLPRFYDVQRGAVRVQGRDVRSWRLGPLRRTVGTVMQEVFLFAGDVAGNIHLGARTVSRASAIEAAQTVGADPFIRRLPAGYDEPVVERGLSLSAGQRQLISFARALAFDPPVLILDEATASIDTETEQALQHAMRTLSSNRTTLIVAHRLSTIQDADRIYVLDHGRIVEQGRHGELLAADGTYATLWRLQAEG